MGIRADELQLTQREAQILQLVAQARPNAEIARTLWVTPQTVKFHLSNIYRKLGVENRIEARRWAQQHRLVDLNSDPPPVER
jgi:DNA-binding CsgD family transcriptional regulator